ALEHVHCIEGELPNIALKEYFAAPAQLAPQRARELRREQAPLALPLFEPRIGKIDDKARNAAAGEQRSQILVDVRIDYADPETRCLYVPLDELDQFLANLHAHQRERRLGC